MGGRVQPIDAVGIQCRPISAANLCIQSVQPVSAANQCAANAWNSAESLCCTPAVTLFSSPHLSSPIWTMPSSWATKTAANLPSSPFHTGVCHTGVCPVGVWSSRKSTPRPCSTSQTRTSPCRPGAPRSPPTSTCTRELPPLAVARCALPRRCAALLSTYHSQAASRACIYLSAPAFLDAAAWAAPYMCFEHTRGQRQLARTREQERGADTDERVEGVRRRTREENA